MISLLYDFYISQDLKETANFTDDVNKGTSQGKLRGQSGPRRPIDRQTHTNFVTPARFTHRKRSFES